MAMTEMPSLLVLHTVAPELMFMHWRKKKERSTHCSALLKSAFAAAAFFCPPAALAENQSFDPHLVALINKLAASPELMNEDYLRVLLGPPTRRQGQPGSPSHLYWHVPGFNGPKYELEKFEPAPGQVTRAAFIINEPAPRVSFKEVEGTFGATPTRRFNYLSQPIEIFSLRPDTQMIFTKPQNTFRVTRAAVTYAGAPLPPPSVFDMMSVTELRKQKIAALHEKKHFAHSLPLLQAHVKEEPFDGEGHYFLAKAYKQTCNLSDAASEYCQALTLSNGNQDLAQRCLDGLRELRLVPPSSAATDHLHDMKLVQNEQRLRQGGKLAYSQTANGLKRSKSKTSAFDYIEEHSPPADHFYPGTLTPRSLPPIEPLPASVPAVTPRGPGRESSTSPLPDSQKLQSKSFSGLELTGTPSALSLLKE